ncbi:MAG: hypothetical protein Q7S65_03935 [Nanoarchaeota archaeon]|nr:hypothetical protein [Nanoarchaeota archaeon]
MELRIDTSKDSHEDIRKAIRMLQSLVGDFSSEQKSAPAEASAELFSLFSDAPSTPSSSSALSSPSSPSASSPSSARKPSATQLLNDLDKPRVELY